MQFCNDAVDGIYPVECIPSNWLAGKTSCLWPPATLSKLKVDSYVRNRVAPDPETWRSFEVLVIASSSKVKRVSGFILEFVLKFTFYCHCF